MKNITKKVTALLLVIVGPKFICQAAGAGSGNSNQLNSMVLLIAVISLIISLFTLAFLFYVKKKNTVDLVNTTEDIQLAIDSLKTTIGKDIRNIRKDANRNNRRDNPRQAQHQDETTPSNEQEDQKQFIKPAPNRKVPHKKHYSHSQNFNRPKPSEGGEKPIE
jgi:hypothetical protein